LMGHALVNGMFWLNPVIPFKIEGFNEGDPLSGITQPIAFDLLGVMLFVIGGWLFRRGTPEIPEPVDLSAGPSEAGGVNETTAV
jgi:hypothetical protein